MKTREIGIVLLATNAYFVLGLRFIRRWMEFYKGDSLVKFYFFSDIDPRNYLPSTNLFSVEYHRAHHSRWVDGTNSKFLNILKLKDCNSDYLYYFDADTNIQKEFTEEWFLGEIVGGEHYSNRTTLKDGKGFDRNPKGNSYVPITSTLPYTYHYGAFFGGEKAKMLAMCDRLRSWQEADQNINYEPPVNDESYINKFFHYHPPKTIPTEEFSFVVSDKGGIGNTRKINLAVEEIKKHILLNKESLWDIQHGKVTYESN